MARVLLYSDGYVLSNVTSSSMQGVYFIVLNIPSPFLMSEHLVHVLSVLPPGNSPYETYWALHSDLVKGAVEGFVDYDADGKKEGFSCMSLVS